MIRLMLVDDHALVRMGFRMLLAESGDIEVVAEADSGEACTELLGQMRGPAGGQAGEQAGERALPDVLVIDLSMPGMGGLEAIRRVLAHHPQVRVLTLSAHDDAAHSRRALKAGALGYLSKRSAPDTLLEAVRTVAAGRRYIDASVAQKLALAELDGGDNPVTRLSEREFAVFLQLARGRTVAQIAADLNLSASTVGTHLYHVKQKLNASNQAELTLAAIRHGLISA